MEALADLRVLALASGAIVTNFTAHTAAVLLQGSKNRKNPAKGLGRLNDARQLLRPRR